MSNVGETLAGDSGVGAASTGSDTLGKTRGSAYSGVGKDQGSGNEDAEELHNEDKTNLVLGTPKSPMSIESSQTSFYS